MHGEDRQCRIVHAFWVESQEEREDAFPITSTLKAARSAAPTEKECCVVEKILFSTAEAQTSLDRRHVAHGTREGGQR